MLAAELLVALVEVGPLIGAQLAQLVADQPGDLHAADRVEQVVRIAAGVDVAHRAVDDARGNLQRPDRPRRVEVSGIARRPRPGCARFGARPGSSRPPCPSPSITRRFAWLSAFTKLGLASMKCGSSVPLAKAVTDTLSPPTAWTRLARSGTLQQTCSRWACALPQPARHERRDRRDCGQASRKRLATDGCMVTPDRVFHGRNSSR